MSAATASVAAPRLTSRRARRLRDDARAPVHRPRRAFPPRGARAAAQDDDFAVFRFTLGIPGFDDADIPRVVGLLGAGLLVANHLASSNPSDAQARTELVGAALSAACVATPYFGRRIDEASAGVRGGALDVPGAEQVFAFADDVDDAAKADIAWGTYALLTQTNARGVIVLDAHGRVRCARGSVRLPSTGVAPPGPSSAVVADLTRTIRASGCVPDGGEEEVYLADRGAIDRVGANEWGWMPPGAESVFVARNLLLASDEPRAFSKKQRSWARAIAKKLS